MTTHPIILTINPGSTSTKIAVFKGDKCFFEKTIRHTKEELEPFADISEQFAFRKEVMLKTLKDAGIDIQSINIIIGRGGLVKPIPSGVYAVNEALKKDLRKGIMGKHASNLGGLIADDIAQSLNDVKAYIADPVVVDEMSEIAHISGHPLFKRISIFHALNQKAVARLYAESQHIPYEQLNLIIAHMGGGISVGAHRKGKVIDVNNTLDGEGAFSPERSGTLPAGQLVDMCFCGKYSRNEVYRMIVGQGGVIAHLGSNDTKAIIEKAKQGDSKCRLIMDALCYNVAKQIGSMAAVLEGDINAIILTGGIAYSDYVCDYIKKMVSFIAPVIIYPGEDEMQALAANGLLVWENKITPHIYK